MRRTAVVALVLAVGLVFMAKDGVWAAVDPVDACKSEKVKAMAAKSKAVLKCWSSWLNNPGKDPGQTKLNACIGTAENTFLRKWNKAETKATKKGANCNNIPASAGAIEEVIEQTIDAILTGISGGIDSENKHSRTLGFSLLKAASLKAFDLLNAESANIKKPNAGTLATKINRAIAKFEGKWATALSKATKKGVAYNGASMDDVETIIDQLVGDLMAGRVATKVTVTGRVLFDDGSPVAGAEIVASLVTEESINSLRALKRSQAKRSDWTDPQFKAKKPLLEKTSPAPLFLQTSLESNTATDAEGGFSVVLGPGVLPLRVLVKVGFQPEGLPAVQTAKWGDAVTGVLDMGTITIPQPQGAELDVSNGTTQNDAGSIQVSGLPPEVDRLFARSYDPDENPEAFPGDFTEMGNIPLNSSVFLWMEALDADGNPVDNLSQAATIRSRVPPSQWPDLEDINSGTDRIEVPIYLFNEDIQMWEQQAEVGWLEDAQRTVLPEDAQSLILDGTFPGDIFAVFLVNHLSWMNVDYAFIGPWTLSRLDPAKRNVDCLFEALQLAKAIAKSAAGRAAYMKFNKAGGDLDIELADAAGPEIKNSDLAGAYGEFKGNEDGDRDDQFHMSNSVWDSCGEGATEEQKKNTILIMAITILHETTHWKWDVKHDDGNWKNAEPGGEAGNQLETDLFGGIITNGAGIKRDGAALDGATRDGWLNKDNWPPPANRKVSTIGLAVSKVQRLQSSNGLEVTLALPKSLFSLGEEIPAEITYRNVSDQPIRVMDILFLEGYPLWFEIVRDGETERVPFRGSRVKRAVDFDQDFVTLQPEETLLKTVNLLRDEQTGQQRYNLVRSGDYRITAFYSGLWGLPETPSNTVAFSVGAGGSISGKVTDATNSLPLSGATVKAIQNNNVLDTTTTNENGDYAFAELPPGTFTIEASAPGFLRTSRENIGVIGGQNTVVNFSLSRLLALGELRLVLTWGAEPRDLDSHLWLPVETPYHLYFGRRGDLDSCPFAALDVDDRDSFGPETITIRQRFTGTYVYAVHNFSTSPDLTASQAQVQVFDSTGLLAAIDVPSQGTGLWWDVLRIHGETGAITEINQLVDDPEPYSDTESGCP